jgi:uncharacterized protein YraI
MKYWSQIPVATRIKLAVIAYLLVLLLVLVMIRAAGLPIGTQIVQAFLDDAVLTAQTTGMPYPGGTPTGPVSSLPPGTPWLRAVNRAPVRTGPDMSYSAPAMLEAGQVMQVIGVSEDRQWWMIPARGYADEKGWVAASDVIVENAASVAVQSVTRAVPTDLLPIAQAVDNVNIRSGPDMKFGQIGILASGMTAEITGKSEDGLWYAIKIPEEIDKTGWVARDYVVTRNAEDVPVAAIPPDTAPGSAAGTLDPSQPYLVAIWEVNVRAGPGQEFAIVGSLKQGLGAQVVGRTEDGLWWAIAWSNAQSERGWVSAEFVQATNGDSAPVVK